MACGFAGPPLFAGLCEKHNLAKVLVGLHALVCIRSLLQWEGLVDHRL